MSVRGFNDDFDSMMGDLEGLMSSSDLAGLTQATQTVQPASPKQSPAPPAAQPTSVTPQASATAASKPVGVMPASGQGSAFGSTYGGNSAAPLPQMHSGTNSANTDSLVAQLASIKEKELSKGPAKKSLIRGQMQLRRNADKAFGTYWVQLQEDGTLAWSSKSGEPPIGSILTKGAQVKPGKHRFSISIHDRGELCLLIASNQMELNEWVAHIRDFAAEVALEDFQKKPSFVGGLRSKASAIKVLTLKKGAKDDAPPVIGAPTVTSHNSNPFPEAKATPVQAASTTASASASASTGEAIKVFYKEDTFKTLLIHESTTAEEVCTLFIKKLGKQGGEDIPKHFQLMEWSAPNMRPMNPTECPLVVQRAREAVGIKMGSPNNRFIFSLRLDAAKKIALNARASVMLKAKIDKDPSLVNVLGTSVKSIAASNEGDEFEKWMGDGGAWGAEPSHASSQPAQAKVQSTKPDPTHAAVATPAPAATPVPAAPVPAATPAPASNDFDKWLESGEGDPPTIPIRQDDLDMEFDSWLSEGANGSPPKQNLEEPKPKVEEPKPKAKEEPKWNTTVQPAKSTESKNDKKFKFVIEDEEADERMKGPAREVKKVVQDTRELDKLETQNFLKNLLGDQLEGLHVNVDADVDSNQDFGREGKGDEELGDLFDVLAGLDEDTEKRDAPQDEEEDLNSILRGMSSGAKVGPGEMKNDFDDDLADLIGSVDQAKPVDLQDNLANAELRLEFAADIAAKNERDELTQFTQWAKENPGKIYKNDKELHKKLLLLQVSSLSGAAKSAGPASQAKEDESGLATIAILDADGTLKCARCMYTPKPDAKFCPKCGNKFCCPSKTCGYQLKLSSKFCPKCGRKLSQKAPAKEGSKDSLEALLKEKQSASRKGEWSFARVCVCVA